MERGTRNLEPEAGMDVRGPTLSQRHLSPDPATRPLVTDLTVTVSFSCNSYPEAREVLIAKP